MGPGRLLFRALVAGPLRARPGQSAVMAGAIALGVAMVSAIHWINASALHSFEQGVQALSGRGDAAVVPTGTALDERLLKRIRQLPEVADAFPALDMKVVTGERESLPLLGIDLLRDAAVRGDHLPGPDGSGPGFAELLQRGAVLLGRDVARSLDKRPGETLSVQVGTDRIRLRVAGLLPKDSFWGHGAVMDIATAQWTFHRVGQLDRIDVLLRDGADREDLAQALEEIAGPGVRLAHPGLRTERLAAMSQAYRANLRALALVGLVTSAFLVYSLLTLAMRRRRRHFALLRVLGLDRKRLTAWLLAEGAVLGVLGSAVGLLLGLGAAWVGVELLGGDLGAGYFEGIPTRLHARLGDLLLLGGLGVLAALAGTLAPVMDSVRSGGEARLRRGAAEEGRGLRTRRRLLLALLALGLATFLARLPAWDGIPLAGYAAIALVLGAGVLLGPLGLKALAQRLPRARGSATALVARGQLLGAPHRGAMVVSATVVAFALLVAMGTLVHSFRGSVVTWLDQVLAADLYVRAGSGDAAYIPEPRWRPIAGWPEVRRLEPFRHLDLDWAPQGKAERLSAPVRLTARDLALPEARAAIQLLRGRRPELGEARALLASEVFARAYDVAPGDTIHLPLAGDHHRFRVVGIWRDYSYRGGHLVMPRETYVELTGDRRADQLALYLAPDAEAGAVRQRLGERFASSPALEIADAGEIRQRSLRAFDRTFAVTYVLLVLAVGVGLVGTLHALAIQGWGRRGELAMLRYLGFRVRDVARILALEAVPIAVLGGAVGLAAGTGAGVILVKVVNQQSFLWSLPVELPWGLLVGAWAVLVAVTTAGGWLVGRTQGRRDPTRAVADE